MNKRLVIRLQGSILLIEALAMLPSLLISLYYGDGDVQAFLKAIGLILVFALPMHFLARPQEKNLRAREGFVAVALAWVLLSVFGALFINFYSLDADIALHQRSGQGGSGFFYKAVKSLTCVILVYIKGFHIKFTSKS